jgi:hypothetical protein
VFHEGPDFNYNEKYNALGSTLMETMLEEVARAPDDDNRKCFGLICTAPDKMKPTMRRKFEALSRKLEPHGPSVLHSFVSKAMGIKLVHGLVPVIESDGLFSRLIFC